MKFTNKLYSLLAFLFLTVLANAQTDSLSKVPAQNLPDITEFYNMLGQDIDKISALLFKHHFLLSDTAAQGSANRTCCPDINYKEKKFYAKSYSNGETEVQLILRNDNKLFSIKLIFPTKNGRYMQVAESELKGLRFQVTESKRNPKEKTSYKGFSNIGITTRRAFVYYTGPASPDSITLDDWKLINDK